MKEPKARHVADVYDDYAEHPCGECSQVYLKSEADRYIAWLKMKRCEAMARYWGAVSCGCIDKVYRDKANKRQRKYNRLSLHYRDMAK